MKIASTGQGLNWAAGCKSLVRSVLVLAVCAVSPAAFAQTTLDSVVILPPSGTDPRLRADFFLPQSDSVSSISVTANGTALDKTNFTFTAAENLQNFSCAVLLLVDKTMGNGNSEKNKQRLLKAVRDTLANFSGAAGGRLFQFEIATIAGGNFEPFTQMGASREFLVQGIKDLSLNGTSPQLYLGLKAAVDQLGAIKVDRKFLVIMSEGVSNDRVDVASEVTVTEAARKAHVHICTIGFPQSGASTNVVQSLQPLAEGTSGRWVQAEADSTVPAGTEQDLLKFMISGGRLEANLAGLTAPVNLEFAILTRLRSYNFAYNVASLPSSPTQGPTATPLVSVIPAHTPAPTPVPLSPLKQLQSWLVGNPIPTTGMGVVLVAIAVMAFLLIRRAFQKPVPPASEPMGENILPEPSPLAWLESLDGDQTRYPISKSAVRIGRKSDNDIVMKNDTISAHHAEILWRGSEFIIADLGSSNQVIVEGKRVERTSLHDGDVIELGEVRLRFLQTPAVEGIQLR